MLFTIFLVITAILAVVGLLALACCIGDSDEVIGGCFAVWVMASLILLLIWAVSEDDKNNKAKSQENTKVEISQEVAKAYYQGQRDYAEGNIHIRDVNYDHCYHWESSPWANMNIDSLPYNPECAQRKGE